jgi:hypothetical protein
MHARMYWLVAVVCLVVVGVAAAPAQANGSFGFSYYHYGGPYVYYDPYWGVLFLPQVLQARRVRDLFPYPALPLS